MGLGGISIWQLLIVLAIVVMVFGTKRLRNMGGDLGSAIKGFRSAMKDGDGEEAKDGEDKDKDDPQVIDQTSESRTTAGATGDAASRKAGAKDRS